VGPRQEEQQRGGTAEVAGKALGEPCVPVGECMRHLAHQRYGSLPPMYHWHLLATKGQGVPGLVCKESCAGPGVPDPVCEAWCARPAPC